MWIPAYRAPAALLVVTLGWMATACDDAPSQAPGSSATATTTASAAPAAKGLAAADNNAEVVALVKTALVCKWSPAGFDAKCAALKKWLKSPLIKQGAADTTLVNLLEDPEPKLRWLAASALKTGGKTYRADRALAARVVAAAERETDATAAARVGTAVAAIDLRKTDLEPRIKKLIESHKVISLRRELVANVMNYNRELMFPYMMTLARGEKDKVVRKAAAAAFWMGTPKGKHAQVCALWLELASEAEPGLAGNSAYHCAFYPHDGGCKAQWDPLLDRIESLAKDGKVESTMMASALEYLHKQKMATEAQKKRALDVARQVAKQSGNLAIARGRAIQLVAEYDPKGKEFAKGFLEDKDKYVRSVAEGALRAPNKPKTPRRQILKPPR